MIQQQNISSDKNSNSLTDENNSIIINNQKIIQIGNFRLGKTIGVGSFGKVKSKINYKNLMFKNFFYIY